MGNGPGRAGNPIYNDVQCGNGPANSAGDEDYDQCPGRVDRGAAGCSIIGPKWDLQSVYGNSPQPSSPSTPSNGQSCEATGTTLGVAINAFSAACAGFKRVDCDPVLSDGVQAWMCASYNITNGTVQPSPAPAPAPDPTPAQPEPAPANPTAGRCDALGDNLGAAIAAYAASCSAPRVDCDPTGNRTQFLCASYNITGKPVVTTTPSPAPTPDPVPATPTPDPVPATTTNNGSCEATGANLGSAIAAYAAKCSLPRKDCDPISGGYMCASYTIGNQPSSGGGTSSPTPTNTPTDPVPATPTPDPAPATPTNNGSCEATGANLGSAIAAYAAKCSLPRKDCDPISGGYMCASYTIGNPSSSGGGTSSPSTPTSAPAPTAGNIRIQAESQSGSGWVNRGDYIEFTSPNSYGSVTYGSLVYNVNIPAAGDWELRWRAKAARQTPGRGDLHNDAWAKMNGSPIAGFHDVRTFRKVFSPGNGSWHIAGTAEVGSHNFSKFRQRFTPGNYRLEISGRSIGYAIDYIEFVQINGQPSTPTTTASNPPTNGGTLDPLGGISQYLDTFNQPYVNGDLLSLHWDSAPDPDDLQAMIFTREILDSRPDVDFIAVNGAKRDATSSLVTGSSEHMKSMFPSAYEAFRNGLNSTAQQNLYTNTVRTFATAWGLTLAAGNRVHVAEGGPSNFTASVIEELLRRNTPVSSLKNIRVVQHSWGWNENNTNDSALLTVRRYASYIRIANGNQGEEAGSSQSATPDFQRGNDARCQAFRARTANSRYSSQWAYATNRLINRCDASDSVEVLWILGIRTSLVPTLERFADRYF